MLLSFHLLTLVNTSGHYFSHSFCRPKITSPACTVLTFNGTKMFADSCFHHFCIHCTILFVAAVPQPSHRLPCFLYFSTVSTTTFETLSASQICQIVSLVLPAVSPMFRIGHATPFPTRVHRHLDSSDFMTVVHGEISVYPFFGDSAVSAHLQSGTFISCPKFSGGPTSLGSLF